MYCPECGKNILEGSTSCNKCGAKLQIEDNQTTITKKENEEQSLKESHKWNDFVANKKVFIPTSIICCLVIIIGITSLAIKPPSVNTVYNKIKDYRSL